MRNMSFLMKLTSLVVLLIVKLLISSPLKAATFTVTSNADAGANTLRQAIIDANALAGADIINFNFAGATTITLTSCLPEIIGTVTINGYSNPGAAAGNLLIEIISSGCPGVLTLGVNSNGSTIRGLVISGTSDGINIKDSNGHFIRGNYIGTNRAGTAMAGVRLNMGIRITGCPNVTVGGTGGQIDRNIISGCTQGGVYVNNSINAVVVNNYIGTDAAGNVDLGNNGNGVWGVSNSHGLRVGGTTAAEMNVISGNNSNGIYMNSCQSPIVKGNIVGIGVDGSTPLGNTAHGIYIEQTGTAATSARIGGATLQERNYSSCNGGFGVLIIVSPGSIIQNNWLGVDKTTGNLDFGNYDAAITVRQSADVQCLNNICSGSGMALGADGISIWDNSPRPIVKGNIIGLGADGTTSLPNNGHGIECLTCDDGVIGGTPASERNVIASSAWIGIQCINSPRVDIINNYIGTDVTGTLNRGGGQTGIVVGGSSNDVMIGTSVANSNIIAYNNGAAGIVLEASVQRVEMTFNRIYCNVGPGIDLVGAANEAVPAPGVTTSTANSISGTGVNGNIVHVYRNFTGDGGVKCNCEGESYIGTTTVAGGTWTLTHNLGLSAAAASSVSATQTTVNKSTSEFSSCIAPLPVELISFSITKISESSAVISWSTATEKNNHFFELQKSNDGMNFHTIQVVQGSGNTDAIHLYSATDNNLVVGMNYYRLQQVDYDGRSSLSYIEEIMVSTKEWAILPEKDGFSFIASANEINDAAYRVYALNGAIVAEGDLSEVDLKIKLSLPPAIYIARVQNNDTYKSYKIFIEE